METMHLPAPDEADKILGYLIWRVSKLWQRRMTNCLKPLGIGSTQFVVLGNTIRLSDLGEAVSQRSLTLATAIDAMTVSQTVRNLEAKGLIRYMPRIGDRRERIILPTATGAHLLREALELVSEAHGRFFDMDKHSEDRLVELLQQLIKENSSAKYLT